MFHAPPEAPFFLDMICQSLDARNPDAQQYLEDAKKNLGLQADNAYPQSLVAKQPANHGGSAPALTI